MTKGKDPYYAGCGLYTCSDGYIVMEIVGITQIQEIFADIGLAHLIGTPEIPKGTQLIHRVECPHGMLVEEKLDAWLATLTIEQALARLAELNIASAKVLTIPELEKTRSTLPVNQSPSGKPWRAIPAKGRM